MKFLYVTDTHGNISIYRKMFELGLEKDIDFLVFGGDMTSGINPSAQKFFIQFHLIPMVKDFRKNCNNIDFHILN